MGNIKDLINNYLLMKKNDADLFDVLHFVQSQIGCIPEDIQKFIAERMCFEFSEVNESNIDLNKLFVSKERKDFIGTSLGQFCGQFFNYQFN